MKKIIVLSILLTSLFSLHSQAQTTEKVLYANFTRVTGAVVSAKLSEDEAAKNPIIDLKARKAYVNGATLSLSRISDFRFEIKEEEVVDGIKSAEIIVPTSTDIYSIDGRLIRKNTESTEGLPKGIYVRNGKKFVIK